MSKRSKVQINYKSGISMVVKCYEFTITRKATGGLSVTWEGASPRPMLLGVEEIESVWEVA